MEISPEILKEKIISVQKSTLKQGLFSKPLEISVMISSKHIYGQGFVQLQEAQQDFEPDYQTFVISHKDIESAVLKPSISKTDALHIQCKTMAGGIKQRIIIPSLKNPEQALKDVLMVKEAVDKEAQIAAEKRKKQLEEAQKAEEKAIAEATITSSKSTKDIDTSIVDLMEPIEVAIPPSKIEPLKEDDNSHNEKNEIMSLSEISALPEIEQIKPLRTETKNVNASQNTPPSAVSDAQSLLNETNKLFDKIESIKPLDPISTSVEIKEMKTSAYIENPSISEIVSSRKPIEVVVSPIDSLICPECKEENREGAKFCISCGFKFSKNVAQEAKAEKNENVTSDSEVIKPLIEESNKSEIIIENKVDSNLSKDNDSKENIVSEDKIDTNEESINQETAIQEVSNSEKKKSEKKSRTSKKNTVPKTIETEEKPNLAPVEPIKNDEPITDEVSGQESKIAVEPINVEEKSESVSEEIVTNTSDESSDTNEIENSKSIIDENIRGLSLEEFETAVRKLKMLKDSNIITNEEFKAQKKKLLANLF